MSDPTADLLLVAGRSGVGKSTVAAEVSARLEDADISHVVIEGDMLDWAHPAPWEFGMSFRNLAAMWANYRAHGYRRLIYTNTVSVLEVDQLTDAMGGEANVTGILLTGSDATANGRLRQREIGSALERHIERSARRASELDRDAPAWVHRIATDGRQVTDIAHDIISLTGWIGHAPTNPPSARRPRQRTHT